jgi:hypothetical protein
MGDTMTELLALSVSVAVLGGIWAFIALGPLGGFALVWVGFIAAGCFFAAGGDTKALSKTIVGMIYGAIVAWIALLIIAKVPVPALGTVWPAIVVGVTVFFLVIVASTDLLSCVPANVYGYAALVGYTLSAGKLDALTAADNSNPLFLIVVSALEFLAVLGWANWKEPSPVFNGKDLVWTDAPPRVVVCWRPSSRISPGPVPRVDKLWSRY